MVVPKNTNIKKDRCKIVIDLLYLKANSVFYIHTKYAEPSLCLWAFFLDLNK